MNERSLFANTVCLIVALAAFEVSALEPGQPIVIAHRGASGYRPEHTLEGYRLAIEQGADYIEPDLVLTKDGALVIRHDHFLSTTTDVADHPEFAARKKQVEDQEDWFTEDFTLAELKTLRARQAFPGRSTEFDGQYQIATLQEAIDLVRERAQATGRTIGIYPETKQPAHFKALGFDFAGILLAQLRQNPDIPGKIPIFIQSFEPAILEELNGMCDLPLVQLVDPVPDGQGGFRAGEPNIPLARIATFADGVGAMKALLVDARGTPTAFVTEAHRLHLAVHVWTLRIDAYPKEYFASGEEEMAFFLKLGIDGFFTDFPDVGVKVRDRVMAEAGQ